jgi:hypothetical protein
MQKLPGRPHELARGVCAACARDDRLRICSWIPAGMSDKLNLELSAARRAARPTGTRPVATLAGGPPDRPSSPVANTDTQS